MKKNGVSSSKGVRPDEAGKPVDGNGMIKEVTKDEELME